MAVQRTSLESRLGRLLSANDPANRAKWAREWKSKGQKVMGIGCLHVPEELMYAAGVMPWRLTGTWEASTPMATRCRPIAQTEPYVNHVLESLLRGEYDFLDGMVTTNWEDDRRQLYDYWKHLEATPFVFILHLPRTDSELGLQEYRWHVGRLKAALEEFVGTEITSESLWNAIEVYDKWRSLMMRVYELRKREVPAISGTEALRLTSAAFVMPKDMLVDELEALLLEIEKRQVSLPSLRPRLLITGDMLDNPGYLSLVEGAGALVAMDDLEAGSRYFWKTVERNEDPLDALAKRYLTRLPSPRMFFWNKGIDQMIEWVREYDIDGVVSLPLRDSFHRLFGTPHLTKRLNEAGIPNISLTIEYHLEMVGQFRTRIQAFIESLETK